MPAGTVAGPHLAVELSEANRLALNYHREGEAVCWQGVQADDLVRRHARMIGELEREQERARHSVALTMLGMLGESKDGRQKRHR